MSIDLGRALADLAAITAERDEARAEVEAWRPFEVDDVIAAVAERDALRAEVVVRRGTAERAQALSAQCLRGERAAMARANAAEAALADLRRRITEPDEALVGAVAQALASRPDPVGWHSHARRALAAVAREVTP